MDTSLTATAGVVPAPADRVPAKVVIPQFGIGRILAIWAAAALPMGALAWIVAPALKDSFAGTGSVQMAKALFVCLTAGLIWQFVLVVVLLRREQGTLRWPTTREALWLRSPHSPRGGRVGGRIWLILVPLILVAAVIDGVPIVSGPSNRDFGTFIGSHAGHAFLSGAWGWYALILVLLLFNTVLGEELLFRGFLLPRMNRAFGRGDWLANGVLFALYHLHEPWEMPSAFLDTFIYAYPTKRYRSAWFGIAVHSASSVFLGIVILTLVA